MFRFLVAVLVLFGLAGLLFGGGPVSGAVAGAGLLFLIPFFLFKVMLVVLAFGFLSWMFGGRGRHRQGNDCWRRSGTGGEPWRQGSRQPSGPSAEDRFREWHDLAHARAEVDEWAPPPSDG